MTASRCQSTKSSQIALLFLTVSALSPLSFAQSAKADREIAFVRGLAREFRFLSLAQAEIGRLEQAFKDGSTQDKIQQLGIEVSLMTAKLKSDRNEQRAAYKQALDKTKELLERSSDPAVVGEARGTLADAVQEFGQFLNEELDEARNTAPERVKELEDEAAATFKSGAEACDKVMESLAAEKDPEKKLQHGLAWLRKGVLTREHARAVKGEREFLIPRAITILEDLILEVGEETALGLRGLFEVAQCREVGGDLKDAIDTYQGTVKQISTALKDAQEGRLQMGADTQEFLFNMAQEVAAKLADVLFKQGDVAGGTELFVMMRQFLADNGEQGEKGQKADDLEVCDPRWGHMLFLAECRFLADSGDPAKVTKALEVAQKINDRHPYDFVGVRAKAVLRDILSAQQKLISGKLLFEVGKGEFQNKNYEEAVKGLRKAIAAMSPTEQKEIGLDAWDMLGKSYGLSDRFLEAVIALKEGLARHGGADKTKAEAMADVLDKALSNLKRQTKNDTALSAIYDEATSAVLAWGGSATGDKKLFKDGAQFFQERKFQEAAEAYGKITTEFLQYEVAQVRIGRCHQALGDFTKARQTFADYRAWAAGKAIEDNRKDKQQLRQSAMTEAAFSEAVMGYYEAYGNTELKLQKDLTKYPAAMAALNAYRTNHAKDGDLSLPIILDFLGRLHADQGQMDQADQIYAELKKVDAATASRLATEMFRQHLNIVGNLEKEQTAALAGGDKTAAEAATRALEDARKKLTALGLDYAANSPKPQLGVLVNTMNSFEQLADWKKVDEVAQKALQLYGNETEAKTKEVMDLSVRPKIGEAMLRQKQFTQAHEMLVAAEKANPNQWELKRLIALALGGWFEFDERGAAVRVPGLDKPTEAYQKYWVEYKQWGLRQPDVRKFSIEWYRFHWEAYWFALQAGAKDPKAKENAQTLFRIAKSTDNFASLKKLGAEGNQLARFFDQNKPPVK
ncbi:MAG: hypothetical protein IPK26_11935 [Planctomycetes bacterium]|nr:hypothetical protein [Planctomycetota bacterium]